MFYPKGETINTALRIALTVTLTSLSVGCTHPQSALDPAGPAAKVIAWLWWGMFGGFSLIFIVVLALWLYAMQRHRLNVSEGEAVRSTRRWVIGGGILLPFISVTILLATGIPAGQHVLTLPNDSVAPLRVEVNAHRWWWEFQYPATAATAEPAAPIITANEFVIPIHTPVDIYVHSDNVIHSFWVPRLGGKMDVVPGRVNKLRLQADELGTMRGQCAEFCGTGHAHMVFQVRVLSEDDFVQWQQRQRQAIVVAAEHQAAADSFVSHCGQCHRVNGISAGTGGPDLSNIGARRLMGAAQQQNQSAGIEHWLASHPAQLLTEETPPHADIAPDQRAIIAAWLETLD
jgi:cytochrome c oxidase subunit 2